MLRAWNKRLSEEERRRLHIYEMLAGGGSAMPAPVVLIRPNSLGGISPSLTFTRTQTAATTATNAYRDWDGTGTFAADTPRYVNDTFGLLLVEGSRTNLFLNSTNPATQNITVAASAHFLSIGPGTNDTQIDLSGVATGTAGSTSGTGYGQLGFTPTAGTLTCTATSGGGDGAAYVQVEANAFPSSFITTGGATANRGADLISASLASLGLPASGAFTMLWGGRTDNINVTGTQTLMHIDDGSNANRYTIELFTGTTNFRGYATNASVNTSNVSISGATSGNYTRVGMTVSAAGRLAFCVATANNAPSAVSSITGGPTSGLTTLRVGANGTGGVNFFGRVGYFATVAAPMTDTQLQTAVAGMPVY